jgi:hypothetical protein
MKKLFGLISVFALVLMFNLATVQAVDPEENLPPDAASQPAVGDPNLSIPTTASKSDINVVVEVVKSETGRVLGGVKVKITPSNTTKNRSAKSGWICTSGHDETGSLPHLCNTHWLC